MTAAHATETQMVGLVRNALMVAGQEMGDKGDHWPVINATIHSIAEDLEKLQIERSVFNEIKLHFENMLRDLEALCENSADEAKPILRAGIAKLLDIYNASFAPIDPNNLYIDQENLPLHIQRAEAIIKTLENDND